MKIEHGRPIEKIIEEQVKLWESRRLEKKKQQPALPVIAVSRQAGSGGHLLARQLAKDLGRDLFDHEIIQTIAENAHMRTLAASTLDERAVSAIESMISAVTDKEHLWPEEYLGHLMRVIGTIAKHGNAVILGRGANLILPHKETLRVRTVAPFEVRVRNAAEWLSLSLDEARDKTMRLEADRVAFIKKYFNAEIDKPENNDLIINTENTTIDAAVEIVKAALKFRSGDAG